jgi:hypothetical protein
MVAPLSTCTSPTASPDLARNSAHPNAQSSPVPFSLPAFQNVATQQLATTAPVAAEPVIAQNP